MSGEWESDLADGPLTGIRVLDLTSFQAGALGAMFLADLGADVIKLEPPGSGDPARSGLEPRLGDDSAYFLSLNRNKRSISVDLKSARGQELVHRLLPTVDVFIENRRPGAMARLGLDYESVREHNPRIVYASVSGYGQSGPAADESALDPAMQAYSGLMSITGEFDGGPVMMGSNVSGSAASVLCFGGVVSALYARERTGEGQRVEVSMLDAALTFLRSRESHYFATGEVPGRVGNVNRYFAPMDVFPTKDGFFQLSVQHDDEWQRLCETLNSTELAEDERFRTNASRLEHRAQLTDVLAPLLLQRTTTEWIATLREAGVMCMPVQDLDSVLSDPQVLHNEMVVEVDHPVHGSLRQLGVPVKFSSTPASIRRPPPLVGADTRAVLREDLGMDDRAIDELVAEGVLQQAADDPGSETS